MRQVCPQEKQWLRDIRLGAIDGIKGLVNEQAGGPCVVDPRRTILVERRVVPEQGEEVGDDEHEARQGDQVWGHPHGEALDDDMGVEGFEDILGCQRMVDAAVFVVPEVWQELLPHVDHLE